MLLLCHVAACILTLSFWGYSCTTNALMASATTNDCFADVGVTNRSGKYAIHYHRPETSGGLYTTTIY